ncbi:MAG: TerC family protein [Burkholderiales bacterium]
MTEFISNPQNWVALMQIIGIDLLLGGDNAVVIALACRGLPQHQQKKAILFGAAAAILIRSLLTVFALYLLGIPYLKIVGSILLVWIGIKLMLPDDGHTGEDGKITSGGSLAGAIKTIIIADVVMSLDNVLAVAAAAHGSMVLIVIGLLISIPIVIYGSTLVLKLMDRYPILITVGAALLGFVAGQMLFTDPAIKDWTAQSLPYAPKIAPIALALLVIAVGTMLKKQTEQEKVATTQSGLLDLAQPADNGSHHDKKHID